MTAPGASHAAYGQASRALGTPRSIEYQVFSRVTGRLRAAMAPDAPFPDLAAALWENQRLWTALMGDLARADNELPEALRGQLVSLGVFVLSHSRRVMTREAAPQPLLEINTAVMRGLRGEPAVAGAA
ncbi:MAG: flagellar biosynthesis regulator FlaF [Pseudomonadota bacterium]